MGSTLKYLTIINKSPAIHYALATIIQVEGSAYRHEGAKMLFSETGERFGTVSAGCLEEDLSHHAMEVIKEKNSKVISYNTSSEDDLTWGQSAGCNGTITIYLEYVHAQTNQFLNELEKRLKAGERLILLKTIDPSFSIMMGLNTITEEYVGNPVIEPLKRYLQDFNETKNVQRCTDPVYDDLIIERIEPKKKLYIFGAGPDVEPLVKLISTLDFEITIIDPREDYCNKGNFPNADTLIVEQPDLYLQHHDIDQNSYVLIMTHHFKWDRTILRYFIQHRPYYLGILGPLKRTKRLLGYSNVPEWIHSPVGLPLNAEGAEEISISIVAQLIQKKNSKIGTLTSAVTCRL